MHQHPHPTFQHVGLACIVRLRTPSRTSSRLSPLARHQLRQIRSDIRKNFPLHVQRSAFLFPPGGEWCQVWTWTFLLVVHCHSAYPPSRVPSCQCTDLTPTHTSNREGSPIAASTIRGGKRDVGVLCNILMFAPHHTPRQRLICFICYLRPLIVA